MIQEVHGGTVLEVGTPPPPSSSQPQSPPPHTPHGQVHACCFPASQMAILCHLLNEDQTKRIENKICESRVSAEEGENLCRRMCKETSRSAE